ncbi:MAG TPA: hypothetical protein DCQ64_04915 [Candidatus Rokubacteria bacterium]|nr:hypothetical protein [Candidatus Rokubacteria bacterium]
MTWAQWSRTALGDGNQLGILPGGVLVARVELRAWWLTVVAVVVARIATPAGFVVRGDGPATSPVRQELAVLGPREERDALAKAVLKIGG